MVALGEAASSLSVVDDDDLIENLDRIGSACLNLRAVSYVADEVLVPGFRALFEGLKRKLLKFHALFPGDASNEGVDNLFKVLAEKVSTLEHFDYSGPVPALHVLPPFVAANPNLKKVKLNLDFQNGYAFGECACPCWPAEVLEDVAESFIESGKPIWRSIMSSFLKTKGLVRLDFSCDWAISRTKNSDMADLCIPARFGSASVRVCNFEYF